MNRVKLLLFLILAFTSTILAQNQVLGFEGQPFATSIWTENGIDWTLGSWANIRSYDAHTGTNSAMFSSGDYLVPDKGIDIGSLWVLVDDGSNYNSYVDFEGYATDGSLIASQRYNPSDLENGVFVEVSLSGFTSIDTLFISYDDNSDMGMVAVEVDDINYSESNSGETINNALSFDGIDDYILIPSSANFNMSGSSYTIELWIYADNSLSYSEERILVECGNGWSSGTYQLTSTADNNFRTNFYGRSSANGCTATNDWSDGSWHHLAAVFDNAANEFRLYFDGSLSNTEAENNAPDDVDVPVYISSRQGIEMFSSMQIDELRIWSTARTEAEIQNNRNTELVGNESGLVAYYQFNQGTDGGNNSSETTLADNGPNSLDGTLHNFDLTGSSSNWVLSGSTLPVELTSFSGIVLDSKAQLFWRTATEVNNYGFQIQRKKENEYSEDGWKVLGFVQGNGTTNSPKNYEFTDLELPNTDKVSYRLKQIDNDGSYEYSKTITIDLASITDVNGNELPKAYSLSQNYPNPFNPETTIKFGLPENGFVELTVYNILGQKVATLLNRELEAGYHQVNFGNNNLPSGMYIYRINVSERFTSIKKMLLMK